MDRSKIVLGSAQFGMPYGVNNQRGQIPKAEIFEILSLGRSSGLCLIDTAGAYGDSEEIIGEYMKREGPVYDVVSKLSLGKEEAIRESVSVSLEKLGVERLYGYIFHIFNDYERSPKSWGELEVLRSEGKIKRTGFSLYYPQEIKFFSERKVVPGIVQLPYSVFDRRFEPFFDRLQSAGIEIHARSVFLQGLIFKDPERLPRKLSRMKDKLVLLNKIAQEFRIPVFAICLNFALHNPHIDKVVVGVDSLANFKELLTCFEYEDVMKEVMPKLEGLIENDEKVVLPVNWV